MMIKIMMSMMIRVGIGGLRGYEERYPEERVSRWYYVLCRVNLTSCTRAIRTCSTIRIGNKFSGDEKSVSSRDVKEEGRERGRDGGEGSREARARDAKVKKDGKTKKGNKERESKEEEKGGGERESTVLQCVC